MCWPIFVRWADETLRSVLQGIFARGGTIPPLRPMRIRSRVSTSNLPGSRGRDLAEDLRRSLTGRSREIRLFNGMGSPNPFSQSMAPSELQLGSRVPF